MSKSEPRQRTLHVTLPKTCEFPRTMFFNEFKVYPQTGFTIAWFFLEALGGWADQYLAVFSDDALLKNKTSLLSFIDGMGSRGAKPRGRTSQKGPHMQALPGFRQLEGPSVVDIVAASYGDESAELCFFVFSMAISSRASSPAEAMEAQPLVLLRSTPEMQRDFLTSLYADK